MLEREYISESSYDTQALAVSFGERLWDGSCILLCGDLGAGKTCFTQGLGKGLGISRTISSPTFTLLKVYAEGRLVLYHLDAYRLEDGFQDVGFSEFIGINGVSVIEWPENISELIPQEYLRIIMVFLEEDKRQLVFQAVGEKYEKLIEEILC